MALFLVYFKILQGLQELNVVKELDTSHRKRYTVPCLATMRLAMQSGTLVPAARKVMPMMTSGIPRV